VELILNGVGHNISHSRILQDHSFEGSQSLSSILLNRITDLSEFVFLPSSIHYQSQVQQRSNYGEWVLIVDTLPSGLHDLCRWVVESLLLSGRGFSKVVEPHTFFLPLPSSAPFLRRFQTKQPP